MENKTQKFIAYIILSTALTKIMVEVYPGDLPPDFHNFDKNLISVRTQIMSGVSGTATIPNIPASVHSI